MNSYDSNLKIQVLLCVWHKPDLLQKYAFCVSPIQMEKRATACSHNGSVRNPYQAAQAICDWPVAPG